MGTVIVFVLLYENLGEGGFGLNEVVGERRWFSFASLIRRENGER